jgi:integrase
VYRLDFFCGARRSEVLALRWPQVDLDRRAISIIAGLHRIPGQRLVLLDVKTGKSRRRIPIPMEIVDMLRSVKGRQIAQAELAIGQPWNAEGFVFCKADGSPFDPEKVTKDFTPRMEAAGPKGITMHSLRHSFASLQLARGEAPKVVQELLDHSSIAVTSDIYSHVIPGMKEAAVDRFAEAFGDTYNR